MSFNVKRCFFISRFSHSVWNEIRYSSSTYKVFFTTTYLDFKISQFWALEYLVKRICNEYFGLKTSSNMYYPENRCSLWIWAWSALRPSKSVQQCTLLKTGLTEMFHKRVLETCNFNLTRRFGSQCPKTTKNRNYRTSLQF